MNLLLSLMAGVDIPIKECQLVVHQPTLKEIAFAGEEDFLIGINTLCIDKTMFPEEEILQQSTNFQILMGLLKEDETKEKKEQLSKIFLLICPTKKVTFTPNSILLLDKDGTSILDENNFDPFQETLRQIFCIKNSTASAFNAQDEKAKEIAAKLMRGRQRVAAQKSDSTASLAQYISTLTIGVHSMSLESCLNLTLFQLYDLIERFSMWTSWDIDIRSRLAGAKIDKPVENWMKNIH